MTPRGRAWPVLLAAGFCFVILILLGTWQLQRLSWKNDLITKIDQRLAEAPVSLSEALHIRENVGDADYLVVSSSGRFLADQEIRKLTSHMGQPGFTVIAPFLSHDGILVLVDRGTVPEQLADPAKRMEPPTDQIKGFLRRHDGGQGFFDAENSATGNQWYWWDVPAMLGAVTVPPQARVMDMVLHRLPETAELVPPIAPLPKADLRNNHLGYAITWFGLAATLAVMTALFLRSGLKR